MGGLGAESGASRMGRREPPMARAASEKNCHLGALGPPACVPASLPPCGTGNPQGRSQPIVRRGADPRDTHRARHPEPPTPTFSCALTPGSAGF